MGVTKHLQGWLNRILKTQMSHFKTLIFTGKIYAQTKASLKKPLMKSFFALKIQI